MPKPRIAILDDYQGVALTLADWSEVRERASISVFDDHLSDPKALIDRLEPFDVICVMRERTPLTRDIIAALPRLKLICSTGAKNASIDTDAAHEHGVTIATTASIPNPPIELTWALILASAKHLVAEHAALRRGGWQEKIGLDLAGHTLGIVGLGRIGAQVAKIALAFGMQVIAWSEHLTAEKASAAGARLVSKEDLFRLADIVTIHLVLGDSTRGLVSSKELRLMKSSALLINTSRGPIVVQQDLLDALKSKRIAGAAVDVFDVEPLPVDHPFRHADSLLATPHIGYVTHDMYEAFYGETVHNVLVWLDDAQKHHRA